MNKIILFFITAFICTLFPSCENEIKPIIDYRCQVGMSSATGDNVYANIPIPITLSVNKNDNTVGKYEFSYEILEGNGDIISPNSPTTQVLENESLPVDIMKLKVSYVPTSIGEHKIMFRFKNEEYVTEALYKVTATDLVFDAKAINLPSKILIDKATAFDIALIQKHESVTQEFDAKVAVVKGKGFVSFMNGTNDTVLNPQTSTIELDSLKKDSIFTRASSDASFKVKIGNNKVQYKSTENGENIILVRVANEYGYTQDLSIPLTVELPEFAINSTSDSIASLGDAHTFRIGITDTDDFGENIYQMSYRCIKNSGALKINNDELEVGAFTNLAKGENIVEFTPKEVGQATLEFLVKDKYNTSHCDTVNFLVVRSYTKIHLSNVDTVGNLYDLKKFNVALEKKNYKGKFHVSVEVFPLESATIKINDKDYAGGRIEVINLLNTPISFVPEKVGDIVLKIKVYDDFQTENIKELKYKVTNTAPLDIKVSNRETALTIDKESFFNFAVNKKNYKGKFQFEIVTNPTNIGTFSIGGKPYLGGRIDITDINNTRIGFIPDAIGDIDMTLKVYDEFGGVADKEMAFTVLNSTAKILLAGVEPEIYIDVPTTFTFSVLKDNYNGNYSVKILYPIGNSSTIKLNGSTYYKNSSVPISKTINTIEYTTSRYDLNQLTIEVSDENGGSCNAGVSFECPITPISVGIESSGTAKLGSPIASTLKVDKKKYTGDFDYEIMVKPADAGTLTLNGKSTETGVMSGTLKSNPASLIFTPKQLGTTIITVKVKDNTGMEGTNMKFFYVENTPMDIICQNNVSDIVLNNPTEFIFKVLKGNYADTRKITYSVTPTTFGKIEVNGTPYIGVAKEVTYGSIKNGLPVKFIPNREGECSLTFTATDEFGSSISKVVIFTVSNPAMDLFLTGVNPEGINQASLGEPYKFYYNIKKSNYNDDFSYWITLDPANVGIIGTNDVTPRGRSGGGVSTITGTIKNNLNGVATGEIRFTPSNPDYLNQTVNITIVARDKWNNEKSKTVRFQVKTSALAINMSRKTTIEVETPYSYYFTCSKPGYTGNFKYSIVGWAEGDKLELSGDNSQWTTYAGGKFDLPHADHTYIRYTPATIGTIPLKLFVYDNTNGEAMQEMTFDVQAPKVTLATDKTYKTGYINEFIPFQLTPKDGKNESVDVRFAVENSGFDGELKFNDAPVIASNSRARATGSSFSVASGSNNKFEMFSRSEGDWTSIGTATNRWKQSATASTTISVENKPLYPLYITVEGQGTYTLSPKVDDVNLFPAGTEVTITAIPAEGWEVSEWVGMNESRNEITITMDGMQNVGIVFGRADQYALTIETVGKGSVTKSPNKALYKYGEAVKLTATPESGGEFTKWSGDAYGVNPTTTINMTGDKSVTATFSDPTKWMRIKAFENSNSMKFKTPYHNEKLQKISVSFKLPYVTSLIVLEDFIEVYQDIPSINGGIDPPADVNIYKGGRLIASGKSSKAINIPEDGDITVDIFYYGTATCTDYQLLESGWVSISYRIEGHIKILTK